MDGRPWSASADGVVLSVRLTPKGGRDAIEGVERLADGRHVLKARVRAAPFEGEANDALTRLIAKTLDVPARAVNLTAGETSRIKRIAVSGDTAALAAKLERLAGEKEK